MRGYLTDLSTGIDIIENDTLEDIGHEDIVMWTNSKLRLINSEKRLRGWKPKNLS